MKRNPTLGSIQSKLIFLLLTLLIPILLVEAVIYQKRFQMRRSEEIHANLDVARAVSEMFDMFVQDVCREESAIGKAFTLPEPLSVERMQAFLDAHLEDYPAVFDLNWVDPRGRIIASTAHEAIGMDVGDRAAIREILNGREWSISNLFQPRTSSRPRFAINRGIRDKAGTLLGVVGATVDPDRLDEMFGIERSARGAIAIVDREGMAVYRYPEIEWTWDERNWLEIYPAIKESFDGKETTSLVEHDIDGVKRILAIAPAHHTRWVVIASRPYGEAIHPTVYYLLSHAALFLLIAIPAFLAAVILSRTIAGPIQSLCKFSMALGRGELSGKVEVDADGPSELVELAGAFNAAADEIRIREEAIQKARGELEIRVRERTSELARANEALRLEVVERRKAEGQLRRLSARLLRAQEEERKRVATELHDSLGSSLSAIKMFLENTLAGMEQGTAGPDAMRRIIDISQDSIHELRRIMTDLRPSILDDFGLVATIGWLCTQFRGALPGIRVEEDIAMQDQEIPEPLKIVIFRLLQESFHNIAKHSQAEWARIALWRTDGVIRLEIEDKGRGFDPEAVAGGKDGRKGMGLTGMRERTELSGGTFLLHSKAGEGTRVEATWPVG